MVQFTREVFGLAGRKEARKIGNEGEGMFERGKIGKLEDFFADLSGRRQKGVYFYRIYGYNEQIAAFIRRYYEEARKSGIVIEGKIQNPDKNNLSYYDEIMGMDFQANPGFILTSLGKWLPRMNEYQRKTVAEAIYDSLELLRKSGKNINMLKNAYIKFMCWLYYKFERIVSRLGEDTVPKILYEGNISSYELMMFSILSSAGCDIVLLEYSGDAGYGKLDPANEKSDPLVLPQMAPFPEGYNLKRVGQEIREQIDREKLYGDMPLLLNCTNAWITGNGLADVRMSPAIRGRDDRLFYNCFYRIRGVEDKLLYVNELYQFQLGMQNSGRKLVIVDQGIPNPEPEEINRIQRSSYTDAKQMIFGLLSNLRDVPDGELKKLMKKAFIDVMLEESAKLETSGSTGLNINKLINKAVYLLCCLRRYEKQLFDRWDRESIACFIYFGACRNANEVLFLRMLARLPADVVLLEPNLNETVPIDDPILYEICYNETMSVSRFPRQSPEVHLGTAAYHAERELDSIIYQDSGIYRNQQYAKANVVTLQTMYEEIAILWDQELKYRPNFSVVGEVLTIPVLCAKISGIKDGNINNYWASAKRLMTDDTTVIRNVPHLRREDPNPVRAFAAEFLKNGRLLRKKIKEHRSYQYGVLREEIQEHMLDKLQEIIDRKVIKGTFENGTEYTIISTVLNLDKGIVRMIQKFDFTKKNPKVIYFCTGEEQLSLEDAVMALFLSRIGFDILFYVPTGYQVVEQYFQVKVMEEHQIGEFVYDLELPDFDAISSHNTRWSWREKIFKRGT